MEVSPTASRQPPSGYHIAVPAAQVRRRRQDALDGGPGIEITDRVSRGRLVAEVAA
jgi:hypothetical protein